ncbi:MAG: hypothetical protein RML36_06150 [Anaerolineae bacterium]|nr:hypothetical protein [Anaerolineae bacterium]
MGLVLLSGQTPVIADRHVPPAPTQLLEMPQPYVPPLLPPTAVPRGVMRVSALAAPQLITDPVLNMRILVIHRTGDADGVFAMVKAYLDILGIPYNTIDTSQSEPSGTVEPGDLWDGHRHGYYYAIFITTSNVWSWLSLGERTLIEEYERNFNVRRVTWYAYPNAQDYGLDFAEVVAAHNHSLCPGTSQGVPLTASLTDAGRQVFHYLRPDLSLSIEGVCLYGYLATPASGAQVTPLMVNQNGRIFLAIYQAPDGREHMVMTMGSFYPAFPPHYLHARLLPYGMINWATRGIFLGERHVYFTPQPDDVLAWGDAWDPINHTYVNNGFRLRPSDLDNLVHWMNAFRASTHNATDFKIEMPFNGQGAEEDISEGRILTGTLTAKVHELRNEFVWLNHTYTHANLDSATYDQALYEINQNNDMARFLEFTRYAPETLLTGVYSGLDNSDVARAAYDLGVRYMEVDASRPGYSNPSPNTGIPHPLRSEILLVPRYATNIFYAATTPEQETDLYNWIYCPGYANDPANTPRCFDYNYVMDSVTNQALHFMLDFSVNATMFHMNNLGDYGNGRTLLGDFVEMLYGKYNQWFGDVPILSPTTQEIGQKMRQRMAYNASGVSGQLSCGNQITLTTVNAATIPVTGIAYGSQVEHYAGQTISYIPMGANSTIVIPGETPKVPAAIHDLTLTRSGNDIILTWSPVTQDTDGQPLTPRLYRVYARANDPYFTPTAGDLIAEVVDTTYTHFNGARDPNVNYTYIVTSVGDNCWKRESGLSNRVGEFDYPVTRGRYNMLAVPFANTGLTRASSLASHIASETGATVHQVLSWDASLGAFRVYEPGNPASEDFSIGVGGSYLVLLGGTGEATVTFTGTIPELGSVSHSLIGGGGTCAYNAISLPLHLGHIVTASSLATSIGGVTQVLQWNAAAGSSGAFEVYEPGSGFSSDFMTRIGYPYFLCVAEAKVWP